MGFLQNIYNKAKSSFSDDKGFFRNNKFTPITQLTGRSLAEQVNPNAFSQIQSQPPSFTPQTPAWNRPEISEPIVAPERPVFKTEAADTLNARIESIKRFGTSEPVKTASAETTVNKENPLAKFLRERIEYAKERGINDAFGKGNRVKTLIDMSPLSMKESAVPMAKNLFGEDSRVGDAVGYGLRGALSLTPFGGLKTTDLTNYVRPDSIKVNNPETEFQQKSQDIGQALYGTALTAPLGGGNIAKNIVGRGVQGAVLGGGMKIGGNILSGEDAFKDLDKGIIGGVENSWKLAITNSLTDKILGKVAPTLTSKSLETGGNLLKNTVSMGRRETAKKLFKHNAGKLFLRALSEVPAENTMFVAVDKLNGKEKRKFMDAWLGELLGNTLGNVAFAGLSIGKQGVFDMNRPQIDAAKNAFDRAAKRLFGGSLESQRGAIDLDAKIGGETTKAETDVEKPKTELDWLKENQKDKSVPKKISDLLGEKTPEVKTGEVKPESEFNEPLITDYIRNKYTHNNTTYPTYYNQSKNSEIINKALVKEWVQKQIGRRIRPDEFELFHKHYINMKSQGDPQKYFDKVRYKYNSDAPSQISPEVKTGGVSTPQNELLNEARKHSNADDFIDAKIFRDAHAAPGFDKTPVKQRMEDGGDYNLLEVVKGQHNQPSDYFDTRVGPKYYMYDDQQGMESLTAINNVKRGAKTVTTYRVVPKNVKVDKLIDGDWISFSKQYALDHGEHRFGEGTYKIIKQEVPAKDVWWDGNDIREWGYDTGKTKNLSRSELKEIWNKSQISPEVTPKTELDWLKENNQKNNSIVDIKNILDNRKTEIGKAGDITGLGAEDSRPLPPKPKPFVDYKKQESDILKSISKQEAPDTSKSDFNAKQLEGDVKSVDVIATNAVKDINITDKGSCMLATEKISDNLLKNGIKDFKVVEGYIDLGKGFKPEHTWIELKDGTVIDKTLEQFNGWDLSRVKYLTENKKIYSPTSYTKLAEKYPVSQPIKTNPIIKTEPQMAKGTTQEPNVNPRASSEVSEPKIEEILSPQQQKVRAENEAMMERLRNGEFNKETNNKTDDTFSRFNYENIKKKYSGMDDGSLRKNFDMKDSRNVDLVARIKQAQELDRLGYSSDNSWKQIEKLETDINSSSPKAKVKAPIEQEYTPIERKDSFSEAEKLTLEDVEGKNPPKTPKIDTVKDNIKKETITKKIIADADKIDSDFKKRKISFAQVVDDLESGNETKDTKILTDWFNHYKKIAESNGAKVGTLDDFFTHIKTEGAEDIIKNGVKPDTFSDGFTDRVYFQNKRTGSLQDYDVSSTALKAYAIESMKNSDLTPAQKAEIKLSNDIADEFANGAEKKTVIDKIFSKPQDVVKKIQDLQDEFFPKRDRVVFDGKEKDARRVGISDAVRSLADRSRMAGEKFYKAFYEPFRNAERNQNIYAKALTALSESELIKQYKTTFIGAKDATKEEMFSRLLLKNKNIESGRAITLFKNNVGDADFKQDYFKDLANKIFSEYAGKDVQQNKVTDKILGQVRAMTGRATLGLNVVSSLNNIFELKRGIAVLDHKSAIKAIKAVNSGVDYVGKYGIDSKSSTALERKVGRTAIGKIVEKLDKGLFYMFDKTETYKDNVLLGGFEEQGKAKGLKGEKLETYVIQKFDQFAIKYGKGQDIGMYRSNLFKTLFQFGQYPVKDLIIALDKTGGALKGDKGDQAYVVKYAIASVAQMALFKKVLNTIGFGGETNTPLDFTQSIIKGEIPFSPGVQSIIGLSQNAADYLTGKELEEYEQEQRNKKITRSIASTLIPASNQLLFKTGAVIDNQLTGYQEKSTGNIANPVSKDIRSILKTGILGPSYDPKRQAYTKDMKEFGYGGLNKAQSDVYRAMDDDKKGAYYDEQVSLNKKKDSNEKVLKTMTGETKEKKPGIIKKILGKKATTEITWEVPSKGTPQAQKSEYKKQIKAVMDAGISDNIPDETMQWYFFDEVDSLPESTPSEKQEKSIKRFSKLDSIYSSETLDQETKDKLIKLSGVSEKDIEYYNKAKSNATVKAMRQEELAGKISREEWMSQLEDGRKLVGDKQIVDNATLNELYERGLLTDAERDYLIAIKYDPSTESFYMDRDYKGGGTGGKTNTQQKKELKALEEIEESFSKQINNKSGKSITDYLKSKPALSKKTETLIGDILSGKTFRKKATQVASKDSNIKRINYKSIYQK